MFRKTLTVFSLIGLLLSVGLWGVSLFKPKYIGHEMMIKLNSGRLLIARDAGFDDIGRDFGNGWQWGGFGGFTTLWVLPSFDRNGMLLIGCPMWLPTLIFGTGFGFCFIPLHRRRKRKKLGLCVKCGYDLRASKERCPECGTCFEKPKRSADCRA